MDEQEQIGRDSCVDCSAVEKVYKRDGIIASEWAEPIGTTVQQEAVECAQDGNTMHRLRCSLQASHGTFLVCTLFAERWLIGSRNTLKIASLG